MKTFISISALALAIGATAAFAQNAAPAGSPPSVVDSGKAPAAATSAPSSAVILSDADAKGWIKKPAYSSDGKSVGEVVAIKRSASGTVESMQLGIGGFMGLGESLVDVAPSQFKLASDRVVLGLTSDQVRALPKAQ